MLRGKPKRDSKRLWQIAFDLKIENLKSYYPKPENTSNEQYYTHAYDDIERFMKKNGFKHQQGSVYDSTRKFTRTELHSVIENMACKFPWLYLCVTKMDATIISSFEHDLTGILTDATVDYLRGNEPLDVDIAADSDELAYKNNAHGGNVLQDLINAAENEGRKEKQSPVLSQMQNKETIDR